MQQIPVSPPAEPAAASKAAGKKGASSQDGEGSFTTALFGAASAEAPQAKGADAASGTAAAKAAAKKGQKGDGAEGEQANPAAAITAAVMEAIQQRQQALAGGQGGQAGKTGDGTALGTTIATPGRTGQTPANGAAAPGQAGAAPGLAGTTPGQTGKAGGQGAADGTIAAATPGGPGKTGKTEALPTKPQVDGIPTDAPKTDAHRAREAQAAIQAGSLQSSAEKNAQAAAQAADAKLAAAHNDARAAEPGRPVPVPTPSASELMQAADAANRSGATQTAATATQSADVQSTGASSPSIGMAGAADAAQPGSVAQPRPVMPAQPVAEQVAVHIQRAAAQGMDRIMIHLNPPELGRVDVRMEVQHDGRVHAIIAADSPDALDALRHDVRGLERALNDAGLKTDQNTLSFELRGGNNGGAGQSPGQQPDADALLDDPDLAELADPSDEEGSSVLLDGVVDIRV